MRIKMALSVASILVTQNLLLANETTKLDDVQVVTSATGYEQKITDAPASISVISQEDLQKKKYSNLAEAIEDVEGVDVRDGEGKTGGLNISIRGMGSENTLILIDGKRQNSAGSSTPNGFGESSNNFLPPLAAIERIEVIRGPMSTLYGSDAMGGVVNIITKKVANEWSGAINVDQTLQESSKYGNNNNINMYASGPIVKDLLGLALRGNYYNREASKILYDDGSNPSSTRDDKGRSPVEGNNWSLGGKLTLTPTDNHDIYLDLFSSKQSYNNDKSQLGTLDNPALATKQASGYKDKLRFEREQITLGHSSRFEIGTLESSIMRNTTETIGRTIPGNIIGNIFNPKMPNHIIGNDRELKSTDTVFDTKFVSDVFSRNIITVGGQYWNSKLVDGIATEDFKQDMWGLFAEDEISITDKLAFTLGGRYDHHDKFGGNFSPRAYAVYTANDNWTVKGGVSQGYKAPKVNDLHDGINGAGGQGATITIGSPDLKPEKSTNYETGVYYNADNGFAANATIFYNQYKDKIETDGNVTISGNPNIPDGTYDQKKNIGKAETQGLEFGTKIPFTDTLDLKANYTYMESEQKSGENKGEPFAKTPKHSLNATLNWQATSKLNTWIKGEYKSDRKRFTEKYSNLSPENKAIYDQIGNEIKAYELFHLGANYKWNKDLTFSATIYNLFDKDFSKNESYTYNGVTKYKFTETSLEGRRLWLAMNLAF
ncbi:TonB-dependent receptor domain-containing protein [Aliarcobacter cryaerophilus]|uniref:TonB-dependent receptor domain-containing protein n=1 Tax=Aliarcobacter cryaerophilus TaxID=28198 RepID=UPI0021B56E44|nr:TonB-dependent receptor [Aliarcobacter cryaerophilus]MCT7406215.1 TonB-dependent receptor [Aliarcobacter cryaerophilus]MCT7504044.1 TonB-dependent receptor [Aliarcobacter cryaerophilus]